MTYKQKEITNRVLMFANYTIENESTVRKTAQKFKVGKSTVFHDLTIKLKEIDNELYRKVRDILDKNKKERGHRGGEARKNKIAEKRFL